MARVALDPHALDATAGVGEATLNAALGVEAVLVDLAAVAAQAAVVRVRGDVDADAGPTNLFAFVALEGADTLLAGLGLDVAGDAAVTAVQRVVQTVDAHILAEEPALAAALAAYAVVAVLPRLAERVAAPAVPLARQHLFATALYPTVGVRGFAVQDAGDIVAARIAEDLALAFTLSTHVPADAVGASLTFPLAGGLATRFALGLGVVALALSLCR
jgi:hypothetical protein